MKIFVWGAHIVAKNENFVNLLEENIVLENDENFVTDINQVQQINTGIEWSFITGNVYVDIGIFLGVCDVLTIGSYYLFKWWKKNPTDKESSESFKSEKKYSINEFDELETIESSESMEKSELKYVVEKKEVNIDKSDFDAKDVSKKIKNLMELAKRLFADEVFALNSEILQTLWKHVHFLMSLATMETNFEDNEVWLNKANRNNPFVSELF